MKVISTTNAPGAIGPYSQGFITNGMVFTSGKIPINHNLQTANSEYARLDKVIGCMDSGAFQLHIANLRKIRHIHAASQKPSSPIGLESSWLRGKSSSETGQLYHPRHFAS